MRTRAFNRSRVERKIEEFDRESQEKKDKKVLGGSKILRKIKARAVEVCLATPFTNVRIEHVVTPGAITGLREKAAEDCDLIGDCAPSVRTSCVSRLRQIQPHHVSFSPNVKK